MECLKGIIKIKNTCEENQVGPFVQDFIDLPSSILAHVASVDESSGADFANNALDSAINQVHADISQGFTNGHNVKSGNVFTLVHNSTFTSAYVPNSGSYISNFYRSAFSRITITSLTFKAQFDGDFTAILDDGISLTPIPLTAQNNVEITAPIDYSTKSKFVKIYAQDSTKLFALMSKNTACGTCSGKKFYMELKGLQNGVITPTPIGFVPYAFVECDKDLVFCSVITNSKHLLGKAIALKMGIIAYTRLLMSPRLNDSTVNINQEAVAQYLAQLESKYRETVYGSVQAYGHTSTKGIVDIFTQSLKSLKNDACIDCSSTIYSSAVAF